MKIYQVSASSIPVKDQRTAKKFYLNVLGMEVKKNRLVDSLGRWSEIGPKKSDTSFTLITWHPKLTTHNLTKLEMDTESFESDYQELLDRKVPILQRSSKGMRLFAEFTDPDGNILVLKGQRK